jgi:hypothetical protein
LQILRYKHSMNNIIDRIDELTYKKLLNKNQSGFTTSAIGLLPNLSLIFGNGGVMACSAEHSHNMF